MASDSTRHDVVVVGAGNAAFTAAFAAREAGASVLVLEKAPFELRGGNTRFTGGLYRIALDGLEAVHELVPSLTAADDETFVMDPYDADAFYADVVRLSDGWCDPTLIRMTVDRSFETACWLRDHGVQFRLYPTSQHRDGKKVWPDHSMISTIEGGEGLSNTLFDTAASLGIEVEYDAAVQDFVLDDDGAVIGVTYTQNGAVTTAYAGAVVLGCGGFEANPEMRVRYLGQGWDQALVRGTQYNTGEMLARVLELGAQPVGNWSTAHAVPLDAYAPDTGDLVLRALPSRTSYMFGITVNKHGHRFIDEGSDFKLYTYAKTGLEVLKQPGAIAYQIFDAQVMDEVVEATPGYAVPVTTDLSESRTGRAAAYVSSAQKNPVVADSIEELAQKLNLDVGTFKKTVDDYNAAVQDGTFDPTLLDGKGTKGLDLPKSNWALRLEKAPFTAYVIACGITFTYGGIKIDEDARVIDLTGRPIRGLFASGEITGGFFYSNYPAGAGLMRGAVFGRIAGESAAKAVAASTAVAG
jgi:tricarballylate dehydrogenase